LILDIGDRIVTRKGLKNFFLNLNNYICINKNVKHLDFIKMKKLVLLLAALVAVTCSASAQKMSKEEKAAQKAAQEAQTAALLSKLFGQHTFKFIPESYEMQNSSRNNIDGYQELMITPDMMRCEIVGIGLIDINRYEIVKEATEKTGYTLVIKFDANGKMWNFSFFANSKNAQGVLRVTSNKSDRITYNGSFRPL